MSSGVGLRSERGPLLLSMMLSMGLIAIDATILSTAVPSIVADIGGFSSFPWLFSIYLLAQSVTVPVYAKLADTLGRKPVMLFGIGVFLLGSLLAGFAWSMGSLVAFRAVQGIGAGAIAPSAMTIVGDIYTVEERARVQGYLSSVWAVAAVIGPALGGGFAQLDAWRWIFFINVPLALIAGALVWRRFEEQAPKQRRRIDYAGATVLTLALSLLILSVLEGGNAWPWVSVPGLLVPAGGIALLVLFGAIERRAPEPVLPSWVLTRRLLVTTATIAFAIGAVMIGLTAFVPTYLEGSRGTAPLVAGFAVATLSIGWPLSSSLVGKLYLRTSFRTAVLCGGALTTVAGLLLALTVESPSAVTVAVLAFFVGAGLGMGSVPAMVAAQSSVAWHERGVVTGAQMFARSAGSAIGVAVLGALANARIAAEGGPRDPQAIVAGTQVVFWAVVVVAALIFAAAALMPRVPVEEAGEAPPAETS